MTRIRPHLCAGLAAVFALTAAAQTRFVDHARREVQLPARVSRVFAAGAPAEVLLYTPVPDMPAGRNRLPGGAAAAARLRSNPIWQSIDAVDGK